MNMERKTWKSLKYGLEVEATCRTEAVLKINKTLGQMKLEVVGMSDVYMKDVYLENTSPEENKAKGQALKNKLLKICSSVKEDVERDASEFDGKPFNGKTMAEYMGYHGAAIGALAEVIENLVAKIPDEYFN